MFKSKQPNVISTLISIALLAVLKCPSCLASSSPSGSHPTDRVNSHNRFLISTRPQSGLLDTALGAAARGDRLKLAKIYRLGLLNDHVASSDRFHADLCAGLISAHQAAKDFYRDGNIGEAIERIRLFFNLTTHLVEEGYAGNVSEVDEWLVAAKIMALPKENCIGALHDYACFLNYSGQYTLAIPVLKAVIHESPERALAYFNLADAEWWCGGRAEATANYHKYKELVGRKRNNEQTSPIVAINPMDYYSNTERPANFNRTAAVEGTPEPALVAILSTRGKLLTPGPTFMASPEIYKDNVAQRPVNANQIRSSEEFPWLEDICRNQHTSILLRALTDETSHLWSKHQMCQHSLAPSSLQKCIELNNDAVLALQDRQPEDAIKKLSEALEIDPGSFSTLGNLAVAFNNLAVEKSDQPKVALKAIHQALALAPFSELVRGNANAILLKAGQNPSSFQTRMAIGHELLDHRDFLSALVEYREALRIRSDPSAENMIADVTAKIATDELLTPTGLSLGLQRDDIGEPRPADSISSPSETEMACRH